MMSLGSVTCINAQDSHSMIDTLKGKKASYYLLKHKRQITATNIHNVDTTRDMYFDNGKMVPGDWELGGEVKYTWDEISKTVKEVLTSDEWNTLVNAGVGFLQIWIVADKAGNSLEIDFTFRNNDPVFTKIDPDRLFQLEVKLKNLLKIEIGERDRNIKNVKYFVALSYSELK